MLMQNFTETTNFVIKEKVQVANFLLRSSSLFEVWERAGESF